MRFALLLALPLAISASAFAQVPANIETELRKIGQIVDPACTEKLYRPLMPANDFNTYWPPDAPQAKSTAPRREATGRHICARRRRQQARAAGPGG
jgi:hypothetical protein